MTSPSPLHLITEHPGISANIRLYVKRDDLLHAVVSGNKWRKLEPVVVLVQTGQFKGILTYGGPFSNHLQAVAAAGQAFGFPTIGVVRGASVDLSNPTMAEAQGNEMQIISVTKQAYNQPELQQEMLDRFPNYYHLPEGGSTHLAADNCRRISAEILEQLAPDQPRTLIVCVPAGTGCTASGVVAGLGNAGSTWIFPAVNYGVDDATISNQIIDFQLPSSPNFRFIRDYTFGKFAVHHPPLIDFVQTFKSHTGILLDPIYTSKMMFGIFDLLEKGHFSNNTDIVAIHTGGLQGWAGFRQRFGVSIDNMME